MSPAQIRGGLQLSLLHLALGEANRAPLQYAGEYNCYYL
jgi:hypothetical protein